MFGYIGIDKPELKIRDFNTFRAYYCGLCQALGKQYCQKSRMLLNYDCTFFYLLSGTLAEEPYSFEQRRCMLHPTERRFMASTGGEKAAALNVILAVGKYRDDLRDDRSAKAWLISKTFSGQYRKAAERFPLAAKATEERVSELVALESEHCKDIDMVSGVFGELLGEIFTAAGDEDVPLRSLGYNLGRFIYLIDAAEDAKKDAESGSYNPFLARFGSFEQEAKECAAFNLYASIKRAGDAYSLLTIKRNGDIMENMLYSALYKKTKKVLDGGNDGSIQRTGRG